MSLSAEEHVRLEALCHARGEDRETVLRRFSMQEIRQAPPSFSKHLPALRSTIFERTEVCDGLACVRLPSGRVFYGYTSKPNHRRAYKYVQDVVSEKITEDTFLLALDVAQRYASDHKWPPAYLLPPAGGTAVELGAYLGLKTIRFADEIVGHHGKVLAVEMMPDNVDILRRNVRENGLQDVIDVIEAGAWNEKGTLLVKGKGRQRNTIADLKHLDNQLDVVVNVDTVDAILEAWGQPVVDLLFVTINGAEVEALQGMDKAWSMVKALHITALYERDGRPSADICTQIALDMGCHCEPETIPERLCITTPSFRNG